MAGADPGRRFAQAIQKPGHPHGTGVGVQFYLVPQVRGDGVVITAYTTPGDVTDQGTPLERPCF